MRRFPRRAEGGKASGPADKSAEGGAGGFCADRAFSLTPVPWAKTGFIMTRRSSPKHPLHTKRAFIISREPSAMAPAQFLQARPGERVLDLCAAPGGKSTQIAAQMKGGGTADM